MEHRSEPSSLHVGFVSLDQHRRVLVHTVFSVSSTTSRTPVPVFCLFIYWTLARQDKTLNLLLGRIYTTFCKDVSL